MPSRRVRLSYPPSLVDRPILYELIQKFDVVTNIRQAEVNGDRGILLIDMRADDSVLNQAIDWLRELGIEVQPITS